MVGQGAGRATCLRCGTKARSCEVVRESPCLGWSDAPPAQATGLLLLGELRFAGVATAEFACLARRRIAQLPQAPD